MTKSVRDINLDAAFRAMIASGQGLSAFVAKSGIGIVNAGMAGRTLHCVSSPRGKIYRLLESRNRHGIGYGVQSFGLHGVSKKHAVTSLVMSDFLECRMNQGVAACAACPCRILG